MLSIKMKTKFSTTPHFFILACSLGLNRNKVIQLVACKNHTQRAKIIRMSVKITSVWYSR
jgi:hypothetical protein